MNVKNNKRKRESIEKIERVFCDMLREKEINQISVTDICNAAKLNRSTFYASFLDIYDLADKLKARLENDFSKRFEIPENQNALAMFKHIYEDQAFYKTYFKLGYDENHQVNMYATAKERENFKSSHMKYHIEFFKNGLNAIIKLWLDGGCRETPEEMAKILKDEYKGRFTAV